MRKILYINGPSFSGKSWLHNKISCHLTKKRIPFSNICFEQYYRTYNAELAFYNAIEQKSEKNLVIAESVQFNQFSPLTSKNIVCWPVIADHTDNMKSIVDLFGQEYVDGRVFGYSVGRIRQLFKRDFSRIDDSTIFNGKNLDEILKMVIKYALK